jgi:transcription factor SPN1
LWYHCRKTWQCLCDSQQAWRFKAGVPEVHVAMQPLKPGDPGFRYHASIPQPARLDYLNRPQSTVNVDPATLRKGPGKLTAMGKKLKTLNAKKSNASAKAAKISIEGRGLLI